MIFRREHLGQHPAVFRAMTGLTVEAFDRLLPQTRSHIPVLDRFISAQ